MSSSAPVGDASATSGPVGDAPPIEEESSGDSVEAAETIVPYRVDLGSPGGSVSSLESGELPDTPGNSPLFLESGETTPSSLPSSLNSPGSLIVATDPTDFATVVVNLTDSDSEPSDSVQEEAPSTTVVRAKPFVGKREPRPKVQRGIFSNRRVTSSSTKGNRDREGSGPSDPKTKEAKPGSLVNSESQPSTSGSLEPQPGPSGYDRNRYKIVRKPAEVGQVSITTGPVTRNQRARARRKERREKAKEGQDVETAQRHNYNKLVAASLAFQRRARHCHNKAVNLGRLQAKAQTKEERATLGIQISKAKDEARRLLRVAEDRLEAAFQFVGKDYRRESWPGVFNEVVVQQRRYLRLAIKDKI